MKHSIERTSPKGPGNKFVGTCRLCGTPGLTFANMDEDCPNQRGLTREEAVIEAITGAQPAREGVTYCDCERGANGLGLAGRVCDCG